MNVLVSEEQHKSTDVFSSFAEAVSVCACDPTKVHCSLSELLCTAVVVVVVGEIGMEWCGNRQPTQQHNGTRSLSPISPISLVGRDVFAVRFSGVIVRGGRATFGTTAR